MMMTPSKCALTLALGLAWPAMTGGTAAQEAAPPIAEAGPPPIAMSLSDAVQMSLKNNLDVRIAEVTPRIRANDIVFQEAAFDPNAGGNATYRDSSQPSTNVVDVGLLGTFEAIDSTMYDYSAGFTDRLRYGASYTAELNLTRFTSTSQNQIFPVTYQATLDLIYTQSLLRNFGKDVNETQIVLARNNQAVSSSQFRQQMLDALKATEDAYWDLVFARQDLDVNGEALRLAEELLKLNRIKVQVGTLPPIEITQAEAEVANREQGVIVAENAVRDAEDALRRVMNMPKEADGWDRPIETTDQPVYVERPVDLAGEMEIAMSRRPDLEQARLETQAADTRLAFDHNQLKWDLGFRATYTLAGLGGDVQQQYLALDPNNPSVLTPRFPTSSLQDQNYFDALAGVRNVDFPTWSATLFLSVPLGNRSAEASYSSSRLAKEQSDIQYESARLNAEVQVRNAARAINTGKKRIEAAEKNVELQKKKVEAEQKKFENGMSTSFQVLTFQNDLITALGTKNRALVDYRKSLSALELAKGTLDEYLKVSVQ